MNCWKSVNLEKQYGETLIFIMSFIVMFVSFIILYIPILMTFGTKPLHDEYFIPFFISFIGLYPAHKLLHLIPFMVTKYKVQMEWKVFAHLFPQMTIKVTEPVKKRVYILALLLPFLVINSLILIALMLLPHYVHYITILLSYHLGICLADFIYLKCMRHTPANCFIEESETGYSILLEREASFK